MPKKVTLREPLIVNDSSPNNSDTETMMPAQNILEEIIAENNPIPNTQAVNASIVKETTWKRNKKDKEEKGGKKSKINIDEEIRQAQCLSENSTHISILSIILAMWTPDFLLHAISTLEKILPMALVKKEYEAKRVIHTLMEYLLMVQKQLLSQKKELGKCPLRNLVGSLLSLESSTIFTEATVTMETSSWILNSYAEKFQGPSSSLHIMATTSTLYTTAVIPTTHVDVHSTMSSQTNKSIEDMLEESFTLGNSRSTTGSISQSICAQFYKKNRLLRAKPFVPSGMKDN